MGRSARWGLSGRPAPQLLRPRCHRHDDHPPLRSNPQVQTTGSSSAAVRLRVAPRANRAQRPYVPTWPWSQQRLTNLVHLSQRGHGYVQHPHRGDGVLHPGAGHFNATMTWAPAPLILQPLGGGAVSTSGQPLLAGSVLASFGAFTSSNAHQVDLLPQRGIWIFHSGAPNWGFVCFVSRQLQGCGPGADAAEQHHLRQCGSGQQRGLDRQRCIGKSGYHGQRNRLWVADDAVPLLQRRLCLLPHTTAHPLAAGALLPQTWT